MKPVISNTKRTWLRHALASRMKSTFVVPAVGAGLLMGAMALSANAANYNANDTATLITAINSAGDGDTITLTGDIALSGDVPAVTHNVTLFSNTYAIDSNGHEGINVNAAGKTLVMGDGNANAGQTQISAGTLSATNDVSFGGTTVVVNGGSNGQTLDYDNSGGNLFIANSITLNGNLAANVNSDVATQNGVLSGGSGLTKTGAGTLILGANNSYTGGTTVTAGMLDVYNASGNGFFLNNSGAVNVGRDVAAGVVNEVVNTGTGGVTNTGTGYFSVGDRSVSGTGNVTTTLDTSGYTGAGAAVQNTGGGAFMLGALFSVGIQPGATNASVDNTSIGDVSQSNDSATLLIGTIDGTANASAFNNTIDGSITSNGGAVFLFGFISNGAGDGNSITNTITGAVDMTDGTVLLGGSVNTTHAGFPNYIYNDIQGNVDIHGIGSLTFQGDPDGTDNNPVYNAISSGSATLYDTSTLSVTGVHNYIHGGVTLNTITTGADTTNLVIGGQAGGNTASVSTPNVVNSLSVGLGGGTVTVNANPYSSEQRNTAHGVGTPPGTDMGYDTDSGHVLVGAFTLETAGSGQSITNTLDSNVVLNGGFANNVNNTGTGDGTPTGGMIIIGASGNDLADNGEVTNQITGTVELNGGSRLHLGGDGFTPGSGAGSSVTNQVQGAVTANDGSYVAMWGEDDGRLHNIIGSGVDNAHYGLTLNDNSIFRAQGVDDAVGGLGTELNDSAIAQLGSVHLESPNTNMHGAYTLNDSSQLWIGSAAAFDLNSSTYNQTIWANSNGNGDVTLNDSSVLKLKSGGSGGWHSANGMNEIKNNLTLHEFNYFDVNLSSHGVNDAVATGVQVDGISTLNNAQVRVTDLDPINYDNGHADFTFGRRHTLVQAAGAGSVVNGFYPNAELYDVNNNWVYAPALNLSTGWDSNSAYLDWLTDFHDVAETGNQRSFGQYLDDLVANSRPDGITSTNRPELSTVLNYLVSQGNPYTYDDFTGDTYSAFDVVGYQNTNNFVNTIATHARQSHDHDWTESFALNAQNGLSGAGAQMSLVKQLLNARPNMQLNAKGDNSYGNDSALWGSVSGHRMRNDGDGSIGSPDWGQDSKSVAVGYQGGTHSFSWGITGGYHDGNIDFNNRNASGDNDGWNAGLNGLWKSKSNVYVNGILSYGHESNSLTRNDGLGTNTSDFNAKSYAALLEIGKRIDKKTYNFTPYVSLLGVKYDRDALSENGIGSGVNSSLNVNGESHSYLTSALGIRIGRDYIDKKTGAKHGGVMLGVSWQHQFSDTDFPVTASLQGAGGMTPSSFTTYGTPLSDDSVGIQLGAYGRLSKSLYGFLNYNGNFSSNQKISSITAGIEYGF